VGRQERRVEKEPQPPGTSRKIKKIRRQERDGKTKKRTRVKNQKKTPKPTAPVKSQKPRRSIAPGGRKRPVSRENCLRNIATGKEGPMGGKNYLRDAGDRKTFDFGHLSQANKEGQKRRMRGKRRGEAGSKTA